MTQPVAAQQTIVEDKTVTDDKTAVVPRTITEERPAFAPDNVPAPGYDFGTVPDPGTAPDHAQDLENRRRGPRGHCRGGTDQGHGR